MDQQAVRAAARAIEARPAAFHSDPTFAWGPAGTTSLAAGARDALLAIADAGA